MIIFWQENYLLNESGTWKMLLERTLAVTKKKYLLQSIICLENADVCVGLSFSTLWKSQRERFCKSGKIFAFLESYKKSLILLIMGHQKSLCWTDLGSEPQINSQHEAQFLIQQHIYPLNGTVCSFPLNIVIFVSNFQL